MQNHHHSPSATTIPPAWRTLARIAWLLLAVGCFLSFLIGTYETVQSPLPSCPNIESGCLYNIGLTQEDVQIAAGLNLPFPLLAISLFFSVGARLVMATVGIIIFSRKSNDWVALLLSGALVTVLLEGIILEGSLGILTSILFGLGIALFFPLPFIFPNGRFIPSKLRWPVVLLTIVYTIGYIFLLDAPAFPTMSGILILIWTLMALFAIPYRYLRVSNTIEKQQTKWIVVGLVVLMSTASFYTIFITIFPAYNPSRERVLALLVNLVTYLAGYAFFSFSVLMAILRSRLWDIDILIRKTLQYGLISTTLGLIYFGSVVVVQTIINGISGQSQSSQLTIALSTLLIAALFNPVRQKIQVFIDRRFYRGKYDAAKTLTLFAQVARDEVDMDTLSTKLVNVINETMQPDHISLWLKPEVE